MLHPVFIIMQLFMAVWICFKGKVQAKYGIDFAFFELSLNTLSFVLVGSIFVLVNRNEPQVLRNHSWRTRGVLLSAGVVAFCS
jgi:hypothetical protein